ncbi:MAG: 50S ribosomal protein L5 [Flavobacteriales bacterium TMED123]|nr:MAG: 50S ribosomal protein L5 [Flavobacteriales bacterium TMED123]|tara:strand:+ start:3008 stop:3754 length:747 start_codon:yes stop_codon:yes gene_type:complete
MAYTPRLREKYNSEIVNNLKGNFKSVMQVPKLVKISLNQGVGKNSADKKFIENAQQEMTAISGQKALITKSKKDISNFKVRKGMPVGIMVTLRGDKMYEFLDRLISATLPRVRDFKGVSKNGFDGRGNYTLGIKEHIVFQEIDLDKINKITGMDITIVTNTESDDEAFDLLKEFGMPFSENGDTKRVAEEAEKKKQAELKKQAEAASVEASDSIEEDNTQEEAEATPVENIEDNNNESSANVDESENK